MNGTSVHYNGTATITMEQSLCNSNNAGTLTIALAGTVTLQQQQRWNTYNCAPRWNSHSVTVTTQEHLQLRWNSHSVTATTLEHLQLRWNTYNCAGTVTL